MTARPRPFLRALLAAAIVAMAPCVAAAAKQGPNVLLIAVDDLNTDLAAFGEPAARTPHIDRLVARGLRFDRAYCQFPLCSPSRESFLSGRRPETTGAIAQGRLVRELQPAHPYLPAHFRTHGWFTAAAGKIFHKNDPAAWDRYEEGEPVSPQEIAALKGRSASRQRGENSPEWLALDSPDADTGDGRVARTVATLLRERAAATDGKPFFLAAGFRKPHLPWTAPKKYFAQHPPSAIAPLREPTMRDIPPLALQTDLHGTTPPAQRAEAVAAYYACVSFIDAQVGVLLAALDEQKLWDTTIVVFLADHGFHLGDHGGLWAKLTTFERSARVPFAIVTPHAPSTGRATAAIVELLDLYPTLADLAGLPRPAGLEGRSLAPLLAAPTSPWPHAAYTTTIHEGIIGRSVRTDGWRFTIWGDALATELYDHTTDPGEYTNLATNPALASVRTHLQNLLAQNPRAAAIPADAQSPRAQKPVKKSAP